MACHQQTQHAIERYGMSQNPLGATVREPRAVAAAAAAAAATYGRWVVSETPWGSDHWSGMFQLGGAERR